MLSRRELEVLSCITEGNSTKEVARILRVAPSTVNAHADSIRRKLGATNRPHAIAIALRMGILTSDTSSVLTVQI